MGCLMTRMGIIDVTTVFMVDFTPIIEEHTCARCGYAPRPYVESNLRMDLWSAPCVVGDARQFQTDTDGRLVLGVEDVTWLALCGDSDDKGWVGSPLPDEGAYGGNGCLTELRPFEVPCVPLEFEADD